MSRVAEKTGPVPRGYQTRDFQPVWDLLSNLEFTRENLRNSMNHVSLSSMKEVDDYDKFIAILKDSLANQSNRPLPYLPLEPNLKGWYAVVYLQGDILSYPQDFWNRIFNHEWITLGEVMDTIINVKNESPFYESSNNYPRVFFIYVPTKTNKRYKSKTNIQINPYLPLEEEARGQIWLSTTHSNKSWSGLSALNTGPDNNYYFGREDVEIPFSNGRFEMPGFLYSKSYDVMRDSPALDNPFLLIPLGNSIKSVVRTFNYPVGE